MTPTLPLVGGLGSTSPDPIAPDLGEGMGSARDAGLDAEAAAATNTHELPLAEQSESEREAWEALGPEERELVVGAIPLDATHCVRHGCGLPCPVCALESG